MVKRIRSLLCAMTLLAVSFVPAFAAEQRVFDEADLLTAEETTSLEQQIAELTNEIPLDLVVVTVTSTEGKTVRDYGDDFYDYNGDFGKGEDKSGALLLIDMGNREVAVSTAGKGILFLTDSRIDTILDDVAESLGSGDYKGAIEAFLTDTKRFVQEGIPDNQYQYNEETGEIIRHLALSWGEAAVAVGVGLAVGGICILIAVSGYKAKTTVPEYAFRQNGALTLTQKDDQLVNRFVTTRKIVQQNNSGGGSGGLGSGGSSVHTSSSGTTHGGGSRGF